MVASRYIQIFLDATCLMKTHPMVSELKFE